MREVQTMRKHSARKWLHFVLDLLPILVLPIFAIYEINHDHNTSIEVEQDINQVVNFNQLIKNGNFENLDYWNANSNSVLSYSDNVLTIDNNNANYPGVYQSFNTVSNHIYYVCATFNGDSRLYFNLGGVSRNVAENSGGTFTRIDYLFNVALDGTGLILFNTGGGSDYSFQLMNVQVFDFTQMFGAGNELSISAFRSYFPNSFYEYTGGTNIIITIGTETLSNTDIGSQMLYAIYKPVKDYFNFNNVFNFGDIYHWFEANMFNGTAPMPIFIVWNIIVYQFLMDLMFLVYSIFMFIIDFTSECLERCFSFSRHGGSR